MSAVLQLPEARLEPMAPALLPAVMAVEQQAYAYPWTEGNFADSLKAGYHAQVLLGGDTLLGYHVAMRGVDEVHLLNVTVAPAFQGQGWGRLMLEALGLWSRDVGAQWLWLEVRLSNHRARKVYQRHGFREVGQRQGYYPAADGGREDALVMSLRL